MLHRTGRPQRPFTTGRAYEIAHGPAAARTARAAADASCEGVSAHLRQTVRLLVSELVSNSVRHAARGSIDPIVVRFAVSSRFVRVAVTDHGPGFEPRVARPDGESESGYGLYLVEQLADRWGTSDQGAMTVWFELARSTGSPARSARLTAAEAAHAGQWLARLCLESVARSVRMALAQRGARDSARDAVADALRRHGSRAAELSNSPGDAPRRRAGPFSTRPWSRTAQPDPAGERRPTPG